MGFSRQEYWSGLPFPPPGEIPNPGIELASPALAVKPLNIIWSYLLPSVGHVKKSPLTQSLKSSQRLAEAKVVSFLENIF